MDEQIKDPGEFEVTELDDNTLDGVSGGGEELQSNGNCSCPPGSSAGSGYTNGNCSCDGSGSGLDQPFEQSLG